MDEVEGLTPEAVKELRRATDLALRATKHTDWAIGSSMAGMVSVELHLRLTFTDIKEKDKTFLLDAPMSKDSLFGESVTAMVEKFQTAKPQSAVFHQLIPCRSRKINWQTPTVCSRSSSLQRPCEVHRSEPSPMEPTRRDWGPRTHPLVQSRQRRQIDLSSTAKAYRPRVPRSSS